MTEWWTYRLRDLLLFSSETYFRLFELYHRDLWPGQLVAVLAGVAILVLAWHRDGKWKGRVVALMFALSWLWVGWAFLLERYATINWAATWFAVGFAVEAVLVSWSGAIRGHLQFSEAGPARRLGLAMLVFALFVQPFVGRLTGRSWTEIELFGVTPDATAIAMLGAILLADRVHMTLLVIPILWCAVSGATLWAMESPEAFVMMAAGLVTIASSVWKRKAEGFDLR